MPLQPCKKTIVIGLDKIIMTLAAIIIVNPVQLYIGLAPINAHNFIATCIGKRYPHRQNKDHEKFIKNFHFALLPEITIT